jgi:hypothetical protein
MRKSFLFAALLLTTLANIARAAADAKESTQPLSLANGIVQFLPPPDPWVLSWVSPQGEAARYTLPSLGSIQISAIAGFAPRNKQAEEPTRTMVLDMLRGSRAKSKEKENVEVVKPLAFETDDRFFCTIREQFRKGPNTFDQTHYYRNLPPHQLIVSVIGLADPPENVAELRKAAEAVSLSGALVPKGQKPPPRPKLETDASAPKSPAPATDEKSDHPELAAAQKELETATAKVEAELLKNPQYKSAKSKADAAESKLKELRDQQPPDRAAIAQASEDWLDAKRPLESLRQAALSKDPAVIDARKKLADARRK